MVLNRVWITAQYSPCNNFPSTKRVSAAGEIFLGVMKQLKQSAIYHLCLCKIIYMWCTPFKWGSWISWGSSLIGFSLGFTGTGSSLGFSVIGSS